MYARLYRNTDPTTGTVSALDAEHEEALIVAEEAAGSHDYPLHAAGGELVRDAETGRLAIV